MQISAKVIADSKSPTGDRITTMVLTFPRYILAEFNTHRMLSKNSASSRAIPFAKLLESVETSPFIPIAWMKDHSGMQGSEFFTDKSTITGLTANHLLARDYAVQMAKAQSSIGLTKQIVNRYLEPFMMHTIIVTGTEWENFFALRCPQYQGYDGLVYRSKRECEYFSKLYTGHGSEKLQFDWLSLNKGQADIHMMATAEAIWDAMNESIPKELESGEWHIPFGDGLQVESFAKENYPNNFEHGDSDLIEQIKIKIATARCARVSYTVVGEEDKSANYENDIKLHDRLAASGHWSPFEHCAQAMISYELDSPNGDGYSGNFRGFIQYRKSFNNENITKLN